MVATAEREKTARCRIITPNLVTELMLKITQIKLAKYTLALQKHLPKRGLQITIKILAMSNTKKAQNCQNIYGC